MASHLIVIGIFLPHSIINHTNLRIVKIFSSVVAAMYFIKSEIHSFIFISYYIETSWCGISKEAPRHYGDIEVMPEK